MVGPGAVGAEAEVGLPLGEDLLLGEGLPPGGALPLAVEAAAIVTILRLAGLMTDPLIGAVTVPPPRSEPWSEHPAGPTRNRDRPPQNPLDSLTRAGPRWPSVRSRTIPIQGRD